MNKQTKESLFTLCMNHKDVFLIDVLNYLHRYMWVYKDLSVHVDGEEICTGHLYGFTNLLISLKRNYPDCGIVLALDGLDKERRSLNPEYKAQRDHSYSVESEMMELLKMCSLVDGVYICQHDDYEADDVINVVSNKIYDLCVSNSINKKVYILSNDKDMYQLVKNGSCCSVEVIIKFNGRGKSPTIINTEAVKDKFNGVGPEDLVKFRSIVGDASDNLKGYYRFRKSYASKIAECFDYDRVSKSFHIKDGEEFPESMMPQLQKIKDDIQLFSSNYEIMKMKDFDFDIIPINKNLDSQRVVEAASLIWRYKLKKYSGNVLRYCTAFRDELYPILEAYPWGN